MHCTISLRHSQIDLTIHFVSFTFNSHPSIGQFIATTSSRDTLLVFQFTHPHRMRLSYTSGNVNRIHFNSRIHTGCGLAKMRMYFRSQKYFNSRIHTECGQCPGWLTSLKTDFNSHIHTECGRKGVGNFGHAKVFQFTHPYRMWLQYLVSRGHSVTLCGMKLAKFRAFCPGIDRIIFG